MDKQIEILLLEFEQPEESIWDEIVSFTEKWNRTKEIKFTDNEPSELAIYFPDEDHKELKYLERILEQKHEERDWIWVKTIADNQSKAEIEDHDYIQIIGDGYPDEFFLNESEALSEKKTCEKCGTVHPHLRKQEGALQVNENFLHMDIYPNNRYKPPGIDLVNMPHGALLVSKKVQHILKGINDLQDYTLADVLDQDGNVSDRLFQLTVNKVILVPDNLAGKGAICPLCGTVLSTMTRGFAIRKDRLGESSFFSRSSSGVSSIYVSKALYQIFQSENVRGLTPVQGADLIND